MNHSLRQWHLEWIPTFNDAGDYNVTFNVTDGELVDQETIIITVNNVNTPPLLDELQDQQIEERDTLSIQLAAIDSENDTLTFFTNAADILPSPFIFNDSTGLFDWETRLGDNGLYSVTFGVTDGELTDEQNITINVTEAPVNHPPHLKPLGVVRVDEGQILIIELNATDQDNDFLTYSTNATEVLPGDVESYIIITCIIKCWYPFKDA